MTIEYGNNGDATIHVADALSIASLGELRRAVEKVRREGIAVRVNLAELTLADRLSLQYLAGLHKEGTILEETPPYIANWITKMAPK